MRENVVIVIVNGVWAEPWWDFRGQAPKNVWLFNVPMVIKWLTMSLKNYSQPKKLYQFLTNMLFLANTRTPGQV